MLGALAAPPGMLSHLIRHATATKPQAKDAGQPPILRQVAHTASHSCRTKCASLAVQTHQQCTHASPQHSTRQLSTAQLSTNTWAHNNTRQDTGNKVMDGAWHVGEPQASQTAADATTDTSEVAAAHAQLPINIPAHNVGPATAQHSPPARATHNSLSCSSACLQASAQPGTASMV